MTYFVVQQVFFLYIPEIEVSKRELVELARIGGFSMMPYSKKCSEQTWPC